MLIAPFTSASIGPQAGQITVSWRGRVHRAPQWWQVMLVPAGFTGMTLRAASSAFPMRMQVNWCQAASRMLLFSPALAAAWFGQVCARILRVGLGRGPSGHSRYVQVFQRDHIALVDQHPRGLVVKVPAPVTDLAPLLGQRATDALPVAGSWLGQGLAPFQVRDHVSRRGEEPRVAHDLAVAGRQEAGNSHVNADLAARRGQRHGLGFGDHDDVPAAVFLLELERLDRTSYLAVLADLDRADSLKCGARPAAAVCRDPLGPIAVDEPDLLEPGVRLEPGIAGLLVPVPNSLEERGECIAEPA
jgi:hypothetical protein